VRRNSATSIEDCEAPVLIGKVRHSAHRELRLTQLSPGLLRRHGDQAHAPPLPPG
jgi:hypothetical protein